MKSSIVVTFWVMLPLTASAQITFGLQGGIPSQTPLGQTNNKMPFVFGPTVDVRLVSGVSLSTGVLFSRAGRRFDQAFLMGPSENAFTFLYQDVQSHAVEIPVLAKYRFLGPHRNWRPFLSAGPIIRRTSVETRMNSSVLGANPAVGAPPLFNVNRESVSWNADPAASAGMDFRAGRFHLEPEVRYSYWGAGKHDPIRKNQVNFLLGIRF